MQCLTNSEIDNWLRQGSIPKDPYNSELSPKHYLQFHAPKDHRRIDAFLREYYKRIVPEADTLIDFTDWSLYQESEMIAISSIRARYGEERRLVDASGHALQSGQKELGISLFSLSMSFAWQAYLYSTQDHSTLYNWDGEILDFWSDSLEAFAKMQTLLTEFDLIETNTKK